MTSSQLDCLLNWLERCTGIAGVKGSNPRTSLNFFQAFFSQLQRYASLTAMVFFTFKFTSVPT